jgi:hypothetical protein
MIHTAKYYIVLVAAGVMVLAATTRGNMIFDLDTATPVLATGQNVPFDQTSAGVMAHFSSPQGAVFSVQSNATTHFILSQFSGKYLYDNNLNQNLLDIQFSQQLSSIALTFSTIEYHDPGGNPTPIQLTAYENSTGTPAVGSTTAYGSDIPGDSYPQGTLLFSSSSPFNLVELNIPFIPQGATAFLVDNITVTTVAPEPISLIFLGVGAMGLFVRQRL